MARCWTIVVTLTILLSGCSGGRPVGRLSAGCPFLASPQTRLYLDSDLIMTEQVEVDAGTTYGAVHGCAFKRGKETVVEFSVAEFSAPGESPATLINSLSRMARGRSTTAMQGLGDAAVYYELQRRRYAVLTVAKQSGPNIRVITVTAQVPFSQTRLAALASVALHRL